MLDFLIMTSIATFEASHEKQNLSHQTILYYHCTLDIDYISNVYMMLIEKNHGFVVMCEAL
jgi:hypothetical protein